jgi:hypothetical protein
MRENHENYQLYRAAPVGCDRKNVHYRSEGKVFKPFGFNLLCLLPFLRHCGLWKEEQPRPPPSEVVPMSNKPMLDYGFFVIFIL